MTTQAEREDIAANWLLEQDDSDFSSEQREELVRWLMQSADNCRAYVKLVRTWHWTALLRLSRQPRLHGKRPAASEAGASPSSPSAGKSTLRKGLVDQRFGDLVRTSRIKQGLSQADLASRAGMPEKEISLIESGERSLSLTSAYLLGRALGMSPSRLMKDLDTLLQGKDPARKGKNPPRKGK